MEKYRSNLKEIRVSMGLTLEELAEKAGVGKRTIISIENEEGANPSIGTVKRLMSYLGVSFEELFPVK